MKNEIRSIKVNAILNVIKQLCAILFPLITIPYASRILAATNYGKVNFSLSIVNYFQLLAMLGINNYAIREGARYRENKYEFTKFARIIFSINIVTMCLSYALLFIITLCSKQLRNYWILILIQSNIILFTVLGTDWVNTVFEDYRYMTIRYICVQVLALILLFTFVHKPDDLYYYAAISTIATTGANIANIFYVRRYVHLKLVKFNNLWYFLKPILILFCNSLAVTIYVNSDITMLGIFKNDYSVGVYSVASKIYIAVKQVINAVVMVTLPRVSALVADNKNAEVKKILSGTINSLISILFPCMIGLFMMSNNIILLVGGSEYAVGGQPLQVLSFALLFAVMGCYFTNSILMPYKLEKYFLLATVIGAASNIILNLFFIPSLSFTGAAITTLIAEFLVSMVSGHYANKVIKVVPNRNNLLATAISCVFIIAICYVCNYFIDSPTAALFTAIIFSSVIYLFIMYKSHNPLVTSLINKLFLNKKIN